MYDKAQYLQTFLQMLRADSKLADSLFDRVDLDKVLGTVLDSVDEENHSTTGERQLLHESICGGLTQDRLDRDI